MFTLKTPEAKGWRKSGDASVSKGMRETVNFNDLIIKSSKTTKDKPVAPPAGYVGCLYDEPPMLMLCNSGRQLQGEEVPWIDPHVCAL